MEKIIYEKHLNQKYSTIGADRKRLNYIIIRS